MNKQNPGQLYQWQKAAAGIFFPQRRCVNCGALSVDDPLCPTCRSAQQQLRPCPHCATFIAATETADYCCAECRHERPPFLLARAPLLYQGYLRDQLLNFKYHQQPGLRRGLAAALVEAARYYYAELDFDAVVPIPLAERRLQERGYNQAELLSHLLSRELQLPHHPEYLHRSKDTQPLAQLNRAQRELELRGAFQAAPVAGAKILLVDDIYTSGATMTTATRALLKAGAATVCAVTVAAGREL